MIWGRAAKQYLNRLHLLQKRMLRVIFDVNFYAHSEPLFQSSGILTIYKLNTYLTALFMFKVKSNILPNCALDLFSCQHVGCFVSTRRSDHFHLPYCKTEKKKKTIIYQGPYL